LNNPSIVLWGMGNPLYGDDAAGSILAKELQGKTPQWLRIFNCETVPENYLAPLRKIAPDFLIIVDAADMGKDPGEIRRMNLADFSNITFSTHGLPLDMILGDLDIDIIIIGIQPLSRDLGAGLSIPVLHAIEDLKELILMRNWENIIYLHQEKRSPR